MASASRGTPDGATLPAPVTTTSAKLRPGTETSLTTSSASPLALRVDSADSMWAAVFSTSLCPGARAAPFSVWTETRTSASPLSSATGRSDTVNVVTRSGPSWSGSGRGVAAGPWARIVLDPPREYRQHFADTVSLMTCLLYTSDAADD